MISFGIAGLVSLLAALCYAEMASAVPTAGSAYTNAYATIGEIFAWIIGWDLILEFALGAAVVAPGWSGYLANLFDLPPTSFSEKATVDIGAIAIVLVLGAVATVGIRESARVTNALVVVKVAICAFVVVAGLFFVNKAHLTPFVPPSQPVKEGTSGLAQPLSQAVLGLEPTAFGFAGVLTAAAVVFFAYTGFEAVAHLGEETRNPSRDLPRGLFGTLALCTVLYMGVSFVITAMVDYRTIDEGAPIRRRLRRRRRRVGRRAHLHRRGRRAHLRDPRRHRGDGPHRLLHGPRPPAAARHREGAPQVGHALPHHRHHRRLRGGARRLRAAGHAGQPGQHRNAVRVHHRFAVWMVIGVVLYLSYGRRNARLAQREKVPAA